MTNHERVRVGVSEVWHVSLTFAYDHLRDIHLHVHGYIDHHTWFGGLRHLPRDISLCSNVCVQVSFFINQRSEPSIKTYYAKIWHEP
jgi:hypothetical protein